MRVGGPCGGVSAPGCVICIRPMRSRQSPVLPRLVRALGDHTAAKQKADRRRETNRHSHPRAPNADTNSSYSSRVPLINIHAANTSRVQVPRTCPRSDGEEAAARPSPTFMRANHRGFRFREPAPVRAAKKRREQSAHVSATKKEPPRWFEPTWLWAKMTLGQICLSQNSNVAWVVAAAAACCCRCSCSCWCCLCCCRCSCSC